MHYIVPSARILEDRKGEWEGGGGGGPVVPGSRELKSKFHGCGN